MLSVTIKDAAFKFVFEVFAFEESTKHTRNWSEQINEMNTYWDKMIDSFSILDFKSFFQRYCQHIYQSSWVCDKE